MKKIMGICLASCAALICCAKDQYDRTTRQTRNVQQFPLAMPNMSNDMFYPEFWIDRCKAPQKIIMDNSQIKAYNQKAVRQSDALVKLETYPEVRTGKQVRQEIRQASPRPKAPRFHLDKTPLSKDNIQALQEKLNLDNIPETVNVTWAIVVRRAELRTFPDSETIIGASLDPELDRFLETGLNTGDELAVLHHSKDGKWAFVQRYNYRGWVLKQHIAFATRKQVEDFKTQQPRLVVTGQRVHTAYAPNNRKISRCPLDMGDSLPLATEDPHQVDGMGTHGNWVVMMPTRNSRGNLQLQPALIPRNSDVNIGYLPLTHENILRQAFKLQGERYGWGDTSMNRDCTGFVISVYRSFGLVLPRNSSDHMTTTGLTFNLKEPGQKTVNPKRLDELQPGDAFESPSHAMLYIGKVNGEHYVIHDTLGATYQSKNGQVYQPLRQITVTPLLSLKYRNGRSMVDNFNVVRRFILTD